MHCSVQGSLDHPGADSGRWHGVPGAAARGVRNEEDDDGS